MENCDVVVKPDELLTYTWSSWSFVVIFVPLIAAFGIFSNCAFVFVVFRVKSMRNVTNIYLVNLAFADSSLLLAAFSQYLGDYIVSPEYDMRFSFHTIFGCAAPNFLIYLCYYASLWTVTLVSLERYLAICHTFWHRMITNKGRAIRMVCLVWVISSLFAFLAAPYTPIQMCVVPSDNITTRVLTIPYCEFACDKCAGALYLTDCFQFFIALFANVIMYSLIVYQLSRTDFATESNSNSTGGNGNNRALQTRNAVAKMLIINGVIFFICLSPFSIANIESIFAFFGGSVFDTAFVNHLGWIGRVLFLVNSSLNPLVYSASNPRYRSAFLQAFGVKEETNRHQSLKTCTSQVSYSTKF